MSSEFKRFGIAAIAAVLTTGGIYIAVITGPGKGGDLPEATAFVLSLPSALFLSVVLGSENIYEGLYPCIFVQFLLIYLMILWVAACFRPKNGTRIQKAEV
jgi:hypothetical protein